MGINAVWIGANDIHKEGTMVWASDNKYVSGGFKNWHTGEPNNSKSLEDCVFDGTLCDKVCQWLAGDRWLSSVSATNKTDRHYIAEILLTVGLSNITLTSNPLSYRYF
jgi:hypothetical protein